MTERAPRTQDQVPAGIPTSRQGVSERRPGDETDVRGFDPADKDQPAEGGRQTIEEDLADKTDEGRREGQAPTGKPTEQTRP